MTTKEFLTWIYNRLVNVYGENPNLDYMIRLKTIIDSIDSLPEDDPLNDPKFCEGFDVGRKVQKIFDEPKDHFRDSTKMVSKDLEEAADEWIFSHNNGEVLYVRDAFIAGAKWMRSQMPMPEDTVIFMKGVEEGRRLKREEREENKRKEDDLPRFYGD